MRGCDIKVDMTKAGNNDTSNPLFLYKSSISRKENANYEPCSDFIDYETITYNYDNNSVEPEVNYAVNTNTISNDGAYSLCSNQDNVVFFPHPENEACEKGFYPINNINILNGDQIYENCIDKLADNCDSDFCTWNKETGNCDKLNKARCKEIVEQGTKESIAPGGTYIHDFNSDNNDFGNYRNYYSDCPDSLFNSEGSAYNSQDFYAKVNITPNNNDFYTKNIIPGGTPTVLNRMNCNNDKDLFNSNHKISDTTKLNTDGPGNLRFRFHKENDLELINNSMGKEMSLNLCSPGHILTLEDYVVTK